MTSEIRKWWVLGAMGASLGLIVLDETVVGVALPTMRTDLSLSQSGAHWVVNAYLLVFACLVAVAGRLGDLYGHGPVMLAGLGFFAAGSAAAGFAPDETWILAARAVQGIGAAVVFPIGVAMVAAVFRNEQRGLALGIHTSIGGIFMSLGPLIGGYLTETLSWRWIFWVNLPVVAAIAVIVLLNGRRVEDRPPKNPTERGRIDVPGLVLLVVALACLVIALMEGENWGWTSAPILSLAAVGLITLWVFIRHGRRAAHPLMDLSLFANRTFSGANLVIFTQQFSKIAVIIMVSQMLQDSAGMSPIDAGALVLVGTVPALLTSTIGGWATDRFGARAIAALGVAANALALLAIGLMTLRAALGWIELPLILWGASLPLLIVPCRRAQLHAVPAEQHGQAGGISVSAQMLGGTVGMAVCGAILTATGSYAAVFLTVGGWALLVLVTAWATIDRRPAG